MVLKPSNRTYEAFMREFGLDRSLKDQFVLYVTGTFSGNFRASFSFYPPVSEPPSPNPVPYTLALQLPAIVLGWIIGNVLGAIAAYKGGGWDKSVFTTTCCSTLHLSFASSIILLWLLSACRPWAGSRWAVPTPLGLSPEWKLGSSSSTPLTYWWLLFISLVLINIGGQAVGMRSMAIYELGSDYVNYSRSLGIGDRKMTGYIFRNAMLPQITGLALSIGTMVGGAARSPSWCSAIQE